MTLPTNRAELLKALQEGQTFSYIGFWGGPLQDPPGPECLSQWTPSPFTVLGHNFNTAEHYMMWEKASLFGDLRTAERIKTASTPKEAKALGREVRGFREDLWVQKRFDIVVAAGLAKFTQNPVLGKYLISTAGKVLVEASPEDRIWGIGMRRTEPGAYDPTKWKGLNLLGFSLMAVRDSQSFRQEVGTRNV